MCYNSHKAITKTKKLFLQLKRNRSNLQWQFQKAKLEY